MSVTPWLDDGDVRIYHGDVLDVLTELPAESVDCVITSPPYYGLRDYGVEGQIGLEPSMDEHVARIVDVFRGVRRVLAPHGTCWVNYGDLYNANVGAGFMNARTGRQNTVVRSGLPAKNLMGIPWRVALALQADGWYLRSCVIWAKPNPLPESVTDRPTTAHEYVFLLAKQPRYYYDAEAVREPSEWSRWGDQTVPKYEGTATGTGWMQPRSRDDLATMPGSRNLRTVWTIPTEPYPDAHFATYPQELVRRCLLAGCPERVCRECGKPSERIVDIGYANPGNRTTNGPRSLEQRHESPGFAQRLERRATTADWTDCGHDSWRPGVVLDPFLGSGTTALVARNHGRHAVGIELNEEYCRLAARRLAQQSLLTA